MGNPFEPVAGPRHPALRPLGPAFEESIFSTMSALASRTGAINLGQGFPDEDGPAVILEAAREAIAAGRNQYPPLSGAIELRTAIAEHQDRFYGLALDPAEEILVTAGATEALCATILALCAPGDEVVVIEPTYDVYPAAIALAGAVRRTVRLSLPDLRLDEGELRAAVGPRTRAILVNTPHNPTGKVFTAAELAMIGAVAADCGAWVITDEVYEHLVYDGLRHVPMATLPGMAERTLTISSAGKTFSVTGWKVGWVSGPAAAIRAVGSVKQFVTFAGGAPFHPAVALGLGLPDDIYAELTTSLRERRDLLADGLRAAGFEVFGGQGTYFLLADAAPLGVDDARAFAMELPERAGVVAIPVGAFCEDPGRARVRSVLRFAYCKRDEVLAEAVRRMSALRP